MKISSLFNRIKIRLKEKTFKDRLKYIFVNNHSDSLMIVFSAFTGNARRYNYLSGFKNIKADRLYILDPFGVKGSYYWYENGKTLPRELTEELINQFVSNKKYNKIYTLGTSKGGTAALFFGLQLNATAIFSGACQYNVGKYVHQEGREDIFHGMMGPQAGDKEADLLNRMMPRQIELYKNASSEIHILYSKQEKTYERQIIDLLAKLNECGLPYIEKEEFFTNHSDVGKYFIPYVREYFENIK